ncbi:hypothetical protein GCM10025771_07330 [Niveibacterium umoris]|uniref:Small-conductance mechanosensitive channel n=1 Tax=Niveibacterium umoris TaxID=1193620 RepID=A0A840BL42_9RHOO|nr:mechanosensitive ion channel domain-containing protein [Niveibacterium umoris]MBB4013720.1 small-conductance mechanosensitive channel [Niveibacterium umoris]
MHRIWTLAVTALLALPAAAATLPGLPLPGDSKKEVAAPAAPAADDAASIEARLKAAEAALSRADNPESATEAPPAGTPQEEVATRKFLLQALVSAYNFQLDMLRMADVYRARAAAVTPTDAANGNAALGEPPYSVVLVDQLRQQLQTVALAIDSVETQQALTAKELELATREHDAAELAVRQSVDAIEANRNPAAAARLSWLRRLALLKAQSIGARLHALQMRQSILAEERSQSNALFRELEARVAQTDHKLRFNQQDREDLLARQSARRAALDEELATARKEAAAQAATVQERVRIRNTLREALEHARDTLDAAQADTAPEAGAPDKKARRRHEAGVAEHEAAVARNKDALDHAQRLLELEQVRLITATDKIDVLTRLVESNGFQRTFWELRYAAAQPGASPDTTAALRTGVKALTDRLSEPSKALRHELQLTLDQIAGLQERMSSADADESTSLRATIETLQDRVRLTLRGLSEVGQLLLMASRWSEEFDQEAANRSADARLAAMRERVVDALTGVWRYEFTTVTDTAVVDGQTIPTQRGVTVGKVCIALLTLFVGFWAARRTARLINRHVHQRLGIPMQTLNTASNWLLSGVFVLLFVTSLAIVRIPLTVFAFLGGAIAIGAGFGMQTLLKNLMSGLMLLAERPFKLGDTVEVAGKRGTVTDIGVRASTIRNIDGIETLIPNASFIEQEVTNWTYTSGKVRFSVKIGVAYGSPTRQVADLLLDVAHRHGKILKEPEPEVLFEDFGADALNFGLYFWLDLDAGTVGRVVTSDVRFMIDKAFADAGIVIAFPQRDVHVDAAKPIEVRVLPAAPPPPLATT